MSARDALRSATREDHERVDALFSGLNLSLAADYQLFLTAQAAAHLPVEAALDVAKASVVLDDWPERRRGHLLRADLANLGADVPAPTSAPTFGDPAAILGAIYVLEGSRLGGALLKRAVPATLPTSFLDADQAKGSWRKLLEKLDEALYHPPSIAVAADAAKCVFDCFHDAGTLYIERRLLVR